MAGKETDNSRYLIGPVLKAGKIMQAIAESKEPLGVKEISERANVTLDTAFRSCVTLEHLGWLQKVNDKYRLGMGLALMWARVKSTLESEREQIEKKLDVLEGNNAA